MATYRSYEGQISAKLQEIRSLALKEGRDGRPPSDAKHPDRHEGDVRTSAERHISDELHLLDAEVTEGNRSLVDAGEKLKTWQTEVHQILAEDSVVSLGRSALEDERAKLSHRVAERLKAEADLKYFRATNDIQEVAKYPDSKWMHFGTLAICVLAEVLINAFFYQNAEGLLGGVFVAFSVAILNLGAAFGLGMAFRYKNLREPTKKALGWGAFVAFILLVVFCNSLFAAFRSQYQMVADASDIAQTSAAFQRAWPQAFLIFVGHPSFQDHWSFILFGVGVILGVWTFSKGYHIDDEFPGHGDKDRTYKALLNDELAAQDVLRQKLKDFLHQRRARVQAAIQEPATQVNMLARREAELVHSFKAINTRMSAIQRDFANAVDTYRRANLEVRTTTAPSYFSEPSVLASTLDSSTYDEMIASIQSLHDRLDTLATQYRDELNTRMTSLQDASSTLLGETMKTFLAEVVKEAEASIDRTAVPAHRLQAA